MWNGMVFQLYRRPPSVVSTHKTARPDSFHHKAEMVYPYLDSAAPPCAESSPPPPPLTAPPP
eukprot:CAMPEP_0181176808 /NCGR_PEP_ID=MMETSP1096-20121128/4824_1 /TAXON_ID=156174 ORGANISM="Chrysochromulina ericina, Strain CCMP281" /NCGR_SAMPLE_ID=MMETSP1096 /ASSEMBLY_ACC=CAM_ASM_000453 /LENGTH=61 /DNA_ID=CAMNT_0023264915 /DNA_START=229 /DNA_END=411 /DNA_ORIENTATION=+